MNAKYIVFKTKQGHKTPLVFSVLLQHSNVAKAMKLLDLEPLSAGFCYLDDDGKYDCYGTSTSLQLKSDPEDGLLLDILLD